MSNPLPVVILATQADLDAVEIDLRTGRRRDLLAFSVQITGIPPHLALSAEKLLNTGYRITGWTEALALGVPAAALAALGAAHLPGLSLAPLILAGLALCVGGLGAVLGASLARRQAKRKMASALTRLRVALQQAAACSPPEGNRARAPRRRTASSPGATAAAEIHVLADERDRVALRAAPPRPIRDLAAAPLAALR